MIAVPTRGSVPLDFAQSFADTCVHLTLSGIGYASHFVIGSSNLPNARNILVARFLASTCTDLFFIDDDMGWKPESVIRLLASEQKVIAGVGRKKGDKLPSSHPDVWCFNALTDDILSVPQQDAMGAIEVAAVGTGFMKVERSVFEMLIAAHPEWKREGQQGMPDDVKANYYQFFRFDPDDSTEMGEDYVFCKRVRDNGGSIWIDPMIGLAHVGTKAWSGCVADYLLVPETQAEKAA